MLHESLPARAQVLGVVRAALLQKRVRSSFEPLLGTQVLLRTCAHIRACAHLRMRVRVHVRVYECALARAYMRVRSPAYARTHALTHACMCACACVSVSVSCVRARVRVRACGWVALGGACARCCGRASGCADVCLHTE